MSMFMTFISAVRENALRMRSKEAAEISLYSEFGEYDKTLWEDYGLVFVDAGYGAKIDSMILAETRFRECMDHNFDEAPGIPVMGKDLLKLRCTSAETANVRFATDGQGQAVRHQAAEYMHYHSNAEYITDLYEAVSDINDYEFSCTGLEAYVQSAMSELSDHKEDYEIAEWTDWHYGAVISEADVSPVTVLSLVMPVSQVSGKKMELGGCVSHRELNKGNYKPGEDLGPVDSLLFKEYLIEKNGDYVRQREESLLSYETEYLIVGKASDSANLAGVVHRILLLREAANFERIYNDEGKMAFIRLIANAVSWVIMEPEAAEPIAVMIAAGWAYVESIKDVKVLLQGGKVPLFKTDGDFYTDVTGSLSGHVEEKGLSYRDYLRAFILATGNGKLTERFMDLMETDVRNAGNDSFRLDLCFDAWAVRAFVTSAYGYDYVLERNMDLWE